MTHRRHSANTRTINRAIAHLGLEIVRGSGYAYFVNKEGDQIGESVMVTYLSHLSVAGWVNDAIAELERHYEVASYPDRIVN
jgi:lysophospholipid acyltransferase (LPLAT)-like uncharacterized protein